MSMDELKEKLHYARGNKLFVPLVISVACLIGGGLYAVFSIQQLRHELQASSVELEKVRNELSTAHANSESSARDLASAQNELKACKSSLLDLNDQITAFAKQAASCEKVKKQLHIKG